MNSAFTVGRGSHRVRKPRSLIHRQVTSQSLQSLRAGTRERQTIRQTDIGFASESLSRMQHYYSLVLFPWTIVSATLSLWTNSLPGYSRIISPMTFRAPTQFSNTEEIQKCLFSLSVDYVQVVTQLQKCKEARTKGISPLQITCWPGVAIPFYTSRTLKTEPRGLQASGQDSYIARPCFKTLNE